MTAVLNFQRALSDHELKRIPKSIANWYKTKRPDYVIFRAHRGFGVVTVQLSIGRVHTWYSQTDGGWAMRRDEPMDQFNDRMERQLRGNYTNAIT